ncbi:MAG: tRNA guanosine(34) transglycosylase Tgt, partial [Candidatus Hydrogenedentes bacterium]|nr:tRNA guanosine(34) transglycosylase Tgt [Candidatus Hydrogenedentota bacterium]
MECAVTYEVEAKDPNCNARAGRLVTPHGVVETPVFMPVGTQATVKAMTQEELRAIGAQIILGNAYHLYLRPGVDVLEDAGGLHRFMGWDRAILTDSGGFQLFSLAELNSVTPDGVTFQSHIDGSRHTLTPESVVDIQVAIGSDVMMCLDECTGYPVEKSVAAESMRMTADWAARCKQRWVEREAVNQALFGIIQGSTFEHLRRESVERTLALNFPGYAIGGVSVGEGKEAMIQAVEWTAPLL